MGKNIIKRLVFGQAFKHCKIARKVPKVTPNEPNMIPEGRNSEPHRYHSKGKKNTSSPPQGKAALSLILVKLGDLFIKTPHFPAVRRRFSDGRNYTIKLQVSSQAELRYKTALKVPKAVPTCPKLCKSRPCGSK